MFTDMESVNDGRRSTRRRHQKERTRRTLLEAARRSLVERGYDGTTIATVAREAGVAHGTVYVHFEGKDALVDELLAEFNASLAARIGPLLGDLAERPSLDALREVAGAFLDRFAEERGLLQCWARRAGAAGPLDALRDGVNPPAVELLSGGLAGLGADPVRGDLVTHGLLGLWLRIGLRYVFGEGVPRRVAVDVLATTSEAVLDATLGAGR